MARPREFARVKLVQNRYVISKDGTPIPPYSYHLGTRQLYTVLSNGQREYHGRDVDRIARLVLDGRATVAVKHLSEFVEEPSPALVRQWSESKTSTERRELLKQHDIDTEVADRHPEMWESIDRELRPRQKVLPQLISLSVPKGSTLKDALDLWVKHKQEENCNKQYLRDVVRTFNRFISSVTNKPVSALSEEDFLKWRRSITVRYHKEQKSAKWHNDCHRYVSVVLSTVKKERPAWGWSSDLSDWLLAPTVKYLPAKDNRQRLPVAEFKRLLKATEHYQSDPDKHSKTTQAGRAKRLQAELKNLEGVRLNALLRLVVNAALDNADVRRLKWVNLHLDGPIPYLDFPRIKSAKKIGIAIDRKTPLLPSTVAALRVLREQQPKGEFVFQSAAGGPYTTAGLDRCWHRLFERAKVVGYTFKHLRNVASSLGKQHHIPKEQRDAILGHVAKAEDGSVTSKFYEDDVGPEWLLPLVRLIGVEYLGETF